MQGKEKHVKQCYKGHKANWEENFYFYLITLKIAISIWYNGIMIVVLERSLFFKNI